jgi:predicted nicotinamide N-methyase
VASARAPKTGRNENLFAAIIDRDGFLKIASAAMAAVTRLKGAYLQGWPLDELISLVHALPGWPSEDAQAAFFEGVLDCEQARQYRPNKRRTSQWLKSLVRSLEDGGDVEVDERLLRMYASLPATASHGVEFAHVHYQVGDGTLVLRVADAWGAGAETGCCLWDAGAWFACHAMHCPERFAARRVIELGAGVGLLSCVLARSGASSLLSTDVYDETLDNLRHNLQANLHTCVPVLAAVDVSGYFAEHATGSACTAVCARLDWLDASGAQALRAFDADLIVAADCVYSEELVDGLVHTLAVLLARPSAVALVACKRRNDQTWSAFQRALALHELHSVEEDIAMGGAVKAPAWRLCEPKDITLLRLTLRNSA